jgi:uncharacterized glyoxalase superfamily protein PhnB
MNSSPKQCRSTIVPGLRYRDALAAIDWLVRAFGFEKHAVYLGANNTVAHAQLTFGNGMIMIGSVDNGSPTACLVKQPADIGNVETQSPYLIVADCDALYASAKAAGAQMIFDLEEKDYGGKGFTCRDPEGHIWHFGSYDPWESTGEK